MKSSNVSSHRRRTAAVRRAQLLAAFDRSGLSAADFARQHQLNYTTFCGWRQRRAKSKTWPDFVQVQMPRPVLDVAASELVVEWGAQVRMRVCSADQIALAAQLLQNLNTVRPC